MKLNLLSALFIFSCSALIGQSDCDHLDCPTCKKIIVNTGFGQTVNAPALGLNGAVKANGVKGCDASSSSQATFDSDDVNYSKIGLKQAVQTLRPGYIKYPAGTASASWIWAPFVVRPNSSNEMEITYYISDDELDADNVTPNVLTYRVREGDHIGSSMLHEKAKSNPSVYNDIGSSMIGTVSGTTIYQMDEAEIDPVTQTVESSKFWELYTLEHYDPNTTPLQWEENMSGVPKRTNNKFHDFLDMCSNANPAIKPVITLKVFDPVVFKVIDVSGVHLSPYYPIDPDYATMIRDEALKELERQLLKLHYEISNHNGATTNENDYNNYLNATVTNWSNNGFVKYVFLNPINTEYKFLLGNELYFGWSEKYLHSFSERESIYAEICLGAIERVKHLFPQAEIAIVGGNRGPGDNWTTEVVSEFQTLCDGCDEDYDALDYHFYPRISNPTISDLINGTAQPADLLSLTAQTEELISSELQADIDGKAIWITEYDINQCEYNPNMNTEIANTWFQTLVNATFFNTILRRDKNIQENTIHTELFNVTSSLPNFESVEMILTHTVGADDNRGIIKYDEPTDSYSFGSLAFLNALQNTLVTSNSFQATPFIFTKAVPASPVDYLVANGTYDRDDELACTDNDNGCDDNEEANEAAGIGGHPLLSFDHPLLYGWEVDHTGNNTTYNESRFFIVNASDNYYDVQNPYLGTNNVPIDLTLKKFGYRGSGDEIIDISLTELGQLYAGAVPNTNPTYCTSQIVSSDLIIPPYSIVVGIATYVVKDNNVPSDFTPLSMHNPGGIELEAVDRNTIQIIGIESPTLTPTRVILTDLHGRVIDEKNVSSNTYQLPNNMSSGMYIVKAFSGGQFSNSLKIFKE
ncbi:MAG: T9SS type A sorting domain-containing protein [Bacteroidota bacterium]